MSAIPWPLRRTWRFDPLRGAAAFWMATMLVAQWAFFYYIVAFYGASVATGELEAWNRLAAFGQRPYVPGDTGGNAAFAAHALGAGIIALAGGLQLLPWVRARFPAFHRWNGRIFLLTVLALSASGFYLVWIRGASPTRLDAFATSANGLLIVAFAVLAGVTARQRRLAAHRHWALRLYLVSNGQWFLRIGVFAYFGAMKALGQSPSFADPFFQFWKFGAFLVPLALLQAYFIAQRRANGPARIAGGALLAAATLAMAFGAAIFGMLCQRIIDGAPLAL